MKPRTTRKKIAPISLRHTVTGNPWTYLRIGLIVLSILVMASIVRRPNLELTGFFGFHASNLGVLYAILVGFIASEVISRRHALDDSVSLELNKIRRIYHLAYHIGKANPELADWFKRIRADLKEYLLLFSRINFNRYAEGNPLFRRVTYGIYELPTEKLRRSNDLFLELIDTAGDATEAREYIRSALTTKYVGYFAWTILFIVSVSFALFLIMATPQIVDARIATGFVIFNLFIVLQLIYEYGRINKRKSIYYCKQYLADLESLGLDKKGSL